MHSGGWVVELELSNDCERVSVAFGPEHLRVVDHEDHSIAFAQSDAGHAIELLHAELQKSFAAFLLTPVELGSLCRADLSCLRTYLGFQAMACHGRGRGRGHGRDRGRALKGVSGIKYIPVLAASVLDIFLNND